MKSLQDHLEICKKLLFDFNIYDCIQECSNALKNYPQSKELRFYLASSYQFIDLTKSISLFRALLDDYPHYFECLLQYLDIIVIRNPNSYFMNEIDKIKSVMDNYHSEKDTFYYLCRAIIELNNGDKDNYQTELDLAKQSLKNTDPNESAQLYYQIGNYHKYLSLDYECHSQEEEREKCLLNLEKQLLIQPNNTLCMKNIGYFLYQINNQDPRINQLLRKAYELTPEDDTIIQILYGMLIEENEIDESFRILRYKIERSPSNISFSNYLDLVDLYFENSKIDYKKEMPFFAHCMKECIKEDSLNCSINSNLYKLSVICYKFGIGVHYIRDIIEFCKEVNIKSLFQFLYYKEFQESPSNILELGTIILSVNEMIEQTQKTLMLISYQKYLQPQLHYKSKVSHLDLYFD